MQVRPVQPYPVTKPYSGGRVKGLFIGINYTGTSGQLRGCINDVRTMFETLQRIQFPLMEAIILVDDPKFPGVAGPPTKNNIEYYMRWLSQGAQPGDTLFLHYSGHGGSQRNRDGTEADGMDETLVPVDYKQAGIIVDDDIYNMVVRPLPAGVRLTAVMDCCHSGTLMDLPFEFEATSSALNSWGQRAQHHGGFKRSNRNTSNADVMLFSGCADSQTSADVSNAGRFQTAVNHPGQAGGACTGALSEVFHTTAGLSYLNLLLAMRQSLAKRGFKQNPQLSASKPIDLGKPFSLFGSLQAYATPPAGPPPGPPAAPPGGYPPAGMWTGPPGPPGYPPAGPPGHPHHAHAPPGHPPQGQYPAPLYGPGPGAPPGFGGPPPGPPGAYPPPPPGFGGPPAGPPAGYPGAPPPAGYPGPGGYPPPPGPGFGAL